MKNKWWRCSFGSVVVAVTMGFAALAPANAAIVVPGRFDPAYGAPFQGTLGEMFWSGTAEFFFDNDCGITATTSGTIDTRACTAYVQNARVDLKVGFDADTAVKFAQLTFLSVAEINQAKFLNGKLVGIASDAFDPWAAPDYTSDIYGISGYLFTLGFDDINYAPGGAMLFDELVSGERHKKEHQYQGKGIGHLVKPCTASLDVKKQNECGSSDSFARVDYYVPEPSSMALMLGGFVLLGLSVRRRRGA